jgi:hypothetical protein
MRTLFRSLKPLVFLMVLQAAGSPLQEIETLDFDTPDFNLRLSRSSQTIVALEPKGAGGFDFTPADGVASRAADRFNAIGDLTLRVRRTSSGAWEEYSTSAARRPVQALETVSPVLAAADLSPTLPVDCPVQVTRRWVLDQGTAVQVSTDRTERLLIPLEIRRL